MPIDTYSSAELENLHEAVNKVCVQKTSGVALTVLRNAKQQDAVERKPKVAVL